MANEPFGPVAVCAAFSSFDDAIEQANRLPYGLAAFAFTENGRRANLLGDAIEAAVAAYASDVKSRSFPTEDHVYSLKKQGN